MREVPLLLVQIAALVAGAPACNVRLGGSPGCKSSPTPPPPNASVDVTGDVACALQTGTLDGGCEGVCGPTPTEAVLDCTLPDDYENSFDAAQPPPGTMGVPPVCPNVAGLVRVACSTQSFNCLGRRTEGVAVPDLSDGESPGGYFAMTAYLEGVSVHAFVRLRAELEALGAPASLRTAIRRAQRDEVRHARVMRGLARRFGVEPGRVRRPPRARRQPFAIARENAVEGCIRETFGAALGLVGAERVADPEAREAMRRIARDECEHARLSWRVARWLTPLLTPEERLAVARAMRDAVSELDPRREGVALGATASLALGGPVSARERARIVDLLAATLFRGLAARGAGQGT